MVWLTLGLSGGGGGYGRRCVVWLTLGLRGGEGMGGGVGSGLP